MMKIYGENYVMINKVTNVTTLSKDSPEYCFSVMSLSLVVKPVTLELRLDFGDTASSH